MKVKTAKGSEMRARIKAAADFQLGAHVKLSVNFGDSRWYVVCAACGAQWSVSETDSSARRPSFWVVIDGDDYCKDGATNYFNAEGNVTMRI